MHILQRQVLAGKLPTESGREHGLGHVADTQHILFAQLICRQIARHVDAAERHDRLEDNLQGRETNEEREGGR